VPSLSEFGKSLVGPWYLVEVWMEGEDEPALTYEELVDQLDNRVMTLNEDGTFTISDPDESTVTHYWTDLNDGERIVLYNDTWSIVCNLDSDGKLWQPDDEIYVYSRTVPTAAPTQEPAAEPTPDPVHKMGNVTGDEQGTIDIMDVIRLLKYVSGWDVSIVEENADVNGDGKTNIMDVIRLLKYVSGWNVELAA